MNNWPQIKASKGIQPVHITADRANKFVYVSNWGGGTFTVFALNADNAIGEEIYHEAIPKGSGKTLPVQEKAHVHTGKWQFIRYSTVTNRSH